jgi:hypothetical protein
MADRQVAPMSHPSLPSFEIQAAQAQAITTISITSTTHARTTTSSTSTPITRAASKGCPFGIDHYPLNHAHYIQDCLAAASTRPPRPNLPPTRLNEYLPSDRYSNTRYHADGSPLHGRERYSSAPSLQTATPFQPSALPYPPPPSSTRSRQHHQRTVMRGPIPTMAPITTASYRATSEQEGDSQSSSSNSPARQDYDESDFYAGNNDSQSSIGVPTFRDMAVSGDVCEPPANRLPAEVLIGIFSKLNTPAELFNAMLVSKRWARNCVDLLWHRPSCISWPKHASICRTLSLTDPTFTYREFIKRLNLASINEGVNDGSVVPLSVCSRVERLTLTACQGLTDAGLIGLLTDSHNLLALDISGDTQITASSMMVLADNCKRLQGLNISGCHRITTESMIAVAKNCRHIKRVSLLLFKSLYNPALTII